MTHKMHFLLFIPILTKTLPLRPRLFLNLQEPMSDSDINEVTSQLPKADPMDRLREYMAESCDDLFRVKGNFRFKAYRWPEIVNLLDEQERAYRSWREDQERLRILSNSLPERPLWLYPPPKPHPVYRSIRKELIVATSRAWGSVKYDLTFWEIRQLVKKSTESSVPGGPRGLQQRANYDELRDLCLQDIADLPNILPADQRADERLYNRAIVRYMIKYWCVTDEEDDGKAIWGMTCLAQRHRRQLGFPDEYYDKCRFSPENRDPGPAFYRPTVHGPHIKKQDIIKNKDIIKKQDIDPTDRYIDHRRSYWL